MNDILVKEALQLALGLAEAEARRLFEASPAMRREAHHGAAANVATIRAALEALNAGAPALAAGQLSFQRRVEPWVEACFGPEVAVDHVERNHRFLEEALELAQACGASAQEVSKMAAYVFARPAGTKEQEVGGVMVTLAALCSAHGMDMHADGDAELAAIWPKVEAIRAKWLAKPSFRDAAVAGKLT